MAGEDTSHGAKKTTKAQSVRGCKNGIPFFISGA